MIELHADVSHAFTDDADPPVQRPDPHPAERHHNRIPTTQTTPTISDIDFIEREHG